MKKENVKSLFLGVFMLLAFVLWTFLIKFIDVDAIGPDNSQVGFSHFNRFFSNLVGVNMKLYHITDFLSLIPLFMIFAFGMVGLFQWFGRKSIIKVDYDILILGGFYIAVLGVYILFEILELNYRPILINGCLEASYPSSTTMLSICVFSSGATFLNTRIKNPTLRKIAVFASMAFMIFMVLGRIFSGVHWITDIIGGILLSFGLILIYQFFINIKKAT